MVEVASKRKLDIYDDLRQAVIVGKYEIMKFFSGKKIFIFGVLMAAVLGLMTAVYVTSGEKPTANQLCGMYIGFISLLTLVGATLFSSVSLVSEFEERTALVLFTKPIRKSSIFLGKFTAAFVLNCGFIVLYYLITAVASVILASGVSSGLFTSLGYCAAYVFALTGIATLFSALMKKASSASILTFVFILIVPSLFISIYAIATNDMNGLIDGSMADKLWFIIDYAGASVTSSVSGTVNDGARDVAVMIGWGLIPATLAYWRFSKREI